MWAQPIKKTGESKAQTKYKFISDLRSYNYAGHVVEVGTGRVIATVHRAWFYMRFTDVAIGKELLELITQAQKDYCNHMCRDLPVTD